MSCVALMAFAVLIYFGLVLSAHKDEPTTNPNDNDYPCL